MDELVKLVVEKTGISEEMAEKAVAVVLEYIKEKLPDSIAGRLDDILEGGLDAGDLMKGLGGLFGG
ncbi:MAG: DUF2267 domain-containing protein [Anaerolineae bacterium]|nr:DUF2267 domain-containing protein [Anaerolineae bacterium]MBL6965252.1 DUF2267 domain-containing protein [Anaerolineales bacterium]